MMMPTPACAARPDHEHPDDRAVHVAFGIEAGEPRPGEQRRRAAAGEQHGGSQARRRTSRARPCGSIDGPSP